MAQQIIHKLQLCLHINEHLALVRLIIRTFVSSDRSSKGTSQKTNTGLFGSFSHTGGGGGGGGGGGILLNPKTFVI